MWFKVALHLTSTLTVHSLRIFFSRASACRTSKRWIFQIIWLYQLWKSGLHSLGRRANARNVSFRISLWWPIHIINPVDKIKLSCNTPHRSNTTVSLETYPLYSLDIQSSTNGLTRQKCAALDFINAS